MTFCTAVSCMDGRIQFPVGDFLRARFRTGYVDVVTEAGVVRILAEGEDSEAARSIFRRVDLSVEAHRSEGIAVVAHHDCAGNPVPEAEQRSQLEVAIERLARRYPTLEIVGLWVDRSCWVNEVCARQPIGR